MSRKKTLKQLVDSLKSRRKELLAKLAEATSNRSGIDVGDSQSINEALKSKLYLAEADSQELVRIDEAIARYQNRKFGVCQTCRKDIPVARLRALPQTTRCVVCQEKADSGELDEETEYGMVAYDRGAFPDGTMMQSPLA